MNHSLICEEHIVLQEYPSGLKWLEFPLQLFDSNNPGYEFDVVLLEQMFIFTLRILRDKTYCRRSGIDQRMDYRAVEILMVSI